MYFITRLLSQAGQGVFIAGLFVMAGQQDSMAIGLSSLIVAMMAGAIVFGLPGGAIADRLGAGRALVLGSVGRASAMTLALVFSGHPELAAVVAFAYSGVSQVYSPAELALVSALAPKRPAGAHSLLVALQHAGQGFGVILLAPAAYLIGGASAMVATGVALYAGVTLLAFIIANSGLLAERVKPACKAWNFGGTIRYLTRNPHALYAGSLLAYAEMAAKAIAIAGPLYLAKDLGLDAFEPATVLIPAVIGVGIGLVWSARGLHLNIAPATMRLTLLGMVVAAIALAGLGTGLATLTGLIETGPFHSLQNATHLSVAVAVPIALLLGICFVVAPIGSRTVLSATAPNGEQGRVFATQAMLTDVLAIAPLLLVGFGTEIAGARAMMLFVGLLGGALFVALELNGIRTRGQAPQVTIQEIPAAPVRSTGA